LSGRERIPQDRGSRVDVDVAVREADTRTAAIAEPALHIRSAIAVAVTQRHNAAAGLTTVADGDEHVAVRCDSHVACGAKAVREDGGAESRRERDADEARRAGDPGAASGRRRGADADAGRRG